MKCMSADIYEPGYGPLFHANGISLQDRSGGRISPLLRQLMPPQLTYATRVCTFLSQTLVVLMVMMVVLLMNAFLLEHVAVVRAAHEIGSDYAEYAEYAEHAPYRAACGESRSVLVRFPDGKPAPGLKVVLTAASPLMGGPTLYAEDSTGDGFGDSTTADPRDVGVSTISTPGTNCTPVVTGTLTSITDKRGLTRFDLLGEGIWVLHFEGEVTRTDEGQTAPVVAASVQGRFPEGRTRGGGGFIEQVMVLNEEGGPNRQPVEPGVGGTTSRYLLAFSAGQGGWLPGLDLAAEDAAPPIPLAGVTPATTTTKATIAAITPEPSSGTITPGSMTPALDASNRRVVPRSGQQPQRVTSGEYSGDASQATVQDDTMRSGGLSGAWWAAVLGVTVGGVVAAAWSKRGRKGKAGRWGRTTPAGPHEQDRGAKRGRQ